MIIIRPRDYSASERFYVWEMARGLLVTMKHLLRGLWGVVTHQASTEVQECPEEARRYPQRARLAHRMTRRPDGTPKCIACELCVKVCPADAIELTAEGTEAPGPDVERTLQAFTLDELRCVQCGFCVEVCPKDALRMDSTLLTAGAGREDFVLSLEQLLDMPPRPGSYLGDRESDANTPE